MSVDGGGSDDAHADPAHRRSPWSCSCQKMNRAPAVEEIQDLVEHQIMAHGAFEVAKHYITYRYTRSLVRKSNTTDDKILSLIECNNEEAKQENSNKNPVVNSTQRDYMAGEVSRDITNRILLPQDIVEAHKEGIIHFHDTDYYAQHMHNCDLVNLEDMLQNGTVITGTLIEQPHSFCHRLQHRHADRRPGGQQPVRRAVHLPDPSGALRAGQPARRSARSVQRGAGRRGRGRYRRRRSSSHGGEAACGRRSAAACRPSSIRW